MKKNMIRNLIIRLIFKIFMVPVVAGLFWFWLIVT